ncbi:MAG: MFS transporter [Candidatus Neomarinimicrobiota bacterium]|nr:MAG: MFS transporter [Candidatus Neomarinimicrobiota bacterium]
MCSTNSASCWNRKSGFSDISVRYRRHVPPLLLHFLVGLSFTNNALYPLYVQSAGGGPQVVGWFMATYYLAAILGRPLIGKALNRLGFKPVLLAGLLLIALTPALFVPVRYRWGYMFLIRLFQGLGFGAYFSAFFTLAAERAPAGRQTETVGIYGLPGMAANLIGPGLGEWIVRTRGLDTFFLILTGVGCLALGLALVVPAQSANRSLSGAVSFRRYRSLMLPFALSFLLAFAWAAPVMFLAPLAEIRHLRGFGLYFTTFALSGIIFRIWGRSWADRFGRRWVLLPAFLLYGAGMLLLAVSATLSPLLLAGIVVGAAHGLAFPAVTTLAYTLAPEDIRGSAMALSTGMLDLGGFSAGFFLGWVAAVWQVSLVFPVATLVAWTAAGLVALHLRTSPVSR